MNTKRKAVLSSPAHSAWCYWHSIKFVGLESKYWRIASSTISPTWCTKSHSKTCNFATYILLAFNEYKKKSCSLFARSFSMMLLTFDQVYRAWIKILTNCEQRNKRRRRTPRLHAASDILLMLFRVLSLVLCALLLKDSQNMNLFNVTHTRHLRQIFGANRACTNISSWHRVRKVLHYHL